MKIKVLWLCQFPVGLLKDEIKFTQEPKSHPGSWIINLALELSKRNSIDLNIITLTPYIERDLHCVYENINIFLLKNGIPYINKGYPYYFRLDIYTKYFFERKKFLSYIEKINPDVIHVHGTEGAYIRLMPYYRDISILSIQGIYSLVYEKSKQISDVIQKKLERNGVKDGVNFGTRTHYDKKFVVKANPHAKIYNLNEAISYHYFERDWNIENIKNDLTLLFVGSVIERKGVHILISAFAKLKKTAPTSSLRIIGGIDKKYQKKLFKIIDKEQLNDSITFAGQLESRDIANELSNCSIFILPSFYENSPNALAEAMAVGVPSIASSTGGIVTMLNNEQNGLLFKTGNVSDLFEKIITLIHDVNLVSRLSSNAKKWAKKNQYPPVVADQVVTVYKKISAKDAS